jgi:hypothetical protein
VREVFLTSADYRWLAELPADERELVLELIRRLDARFLDSHGSLNASFAAELECRYGTGQGPR